MRAIYFVVTTRIQLLWKTFPGEKTNFSEQRLCKLFSFYYTKHLHKFNFLFLFFLSVFYAEPIKETVSFRRYFGLSTICLCFRGSSRDLFIFRWSHSTHSSEYTIHYKVYTIYTVKEKDKQRRYCYNDITYPTLTILFIRIMPCYTVNYFVLCRKQFMFAFFYTNNLLPSISL